MGNKFEVVIYCRKGKHRYQATFEEKEPGQWYGVNSKPLEPISIFEKIKLKNQQKSVGMFKLKSLNNSMKNVRGTFYATNLCCPNCGATSFIKCGQCGELTCLINGNKKFNCAFCGNKGEVSGYISSMSGNSNSNSKENSKKW